MKSDAYGIFFRLVLSHRLTWIVLSCKELWFSLVLYFKALIYYIITSENATLERQMYDDLFDM